MKFFNVLVCLSIIFLIGCNVEDDESFLDDSNPDLIISNLGFSYNDIDGNGFLSVNDNIRLQIIIRNIGRGTSESCKLVVKLYRQGLAGTVFVDRIDLSVPYLYRDESKIFDNIGITVNQSGNYQIACYIDYEDEVQELDESNNYREIGFNVIGGSDLIISELYLEYADEDMNGFLSMGDDMNLKVKVKNIGDETSMGSHIAFKLYKVEYQGLVFVDREDRYTPQLYPGGIESYSLGIQVPESGDYRVVCEADFDDETPELDESNNWADIDFYVSP